VHLLEFLETETDCSQMSGTWGAQSGMKELNDIIGQLESSTDPEDVLRRLVLEDGGNWPDALEPDGRHLVEIQFRGVTGFGFSEAAATRNWLENARRDVEDHGWLARLRRGADHAAAGEGVSSIL